MEHQQIQNILEKQKEYYKANRKNKKEYQLSN